MTFRHVSPNGEYRALRLLSEGGRWELGISPYSHGMRMRMGFTGHPPRVMDFCMGRDAELWPEVLVAVLGKLEGLGEMVGAEEVDAVFPWAGTRADLSKHLEKLTTPDDRAIYLTRLPS